MMRALLCALLITLTGATSQSQGVTPIQKVISMLNDMLAKGQKEKQDEEVRFAAYQGFCDSNAKQKTKSITEGKESIEQLTADIGVAEANAMTAVKEIAAHDKDIAVWQDDMKKAKAIRDEAHATFEEAHADYSNSIDAVERAVAVLKAGPSALVQTSLLQLSSMHRVPAHAKKVFMSFLQTSDAPNFAALMQDADALETSAPEAKAFESSSGGVIDMVEKLGAKFEEERSELEKTEAEERHSHDMATQGLTNQVQAATQERNSASASKSQNEQDKASAEGDLADAKSTLAADEKFLSELTSECELKTQDFNKRQEMRQGELDAIKKAIEIMSSDAVAGSGEKHLPSLMQDGTSLAQFRSRMQSETQSVVASFLRDSAQRTGSRILSLLAVKASSDPFKKVSKMIKDMIFKLMEEANEEAEHKGFCDTELTTNQQTRDTKTEDAELLNSEIEALTADIAKLGLDIADLGAEVAELDAALAKATQERAEEKEKNTATIADAKAGQAAVAQALQVLKDFYDKAASATALVQVPGAPDTFGDEPYTGMSGGGVLGMLEVCESDFARLDAETTAGEEDAANAFNEFNSNTLTDKAVKSTNAKHKTGQKQQKESALATAKNDLKATQEELDAALEYYAKLKPSCVDAGESYEERVARRKAEIESLQEALKILSGDAV